MCLRLNKNRQTLCQLAETGQVASFEELEALMFNFENVLKGLGLAIKSGSDLEGACCSILEVLGKNRDKSIRKSGEDIRQVFTEALGLWIFIQKIVRHQKHPSLKTFVPHLELLNRGTVGQNKRLRACEDAANKIFELLFALVLLDLSTDVRLAHPDIEDTSNPDILATLDGNLWGFACKTIYGPSAKTFFASLKKAVDQIQVSGATVGCVMMNLRNAFDYNTFWPILNEEEYRKGGEPVFASYTEPEKVVGPKIWQAVTKKRDDVVNEIEYQNLLNVFSGKKAIPGFLAFCQTVTGKTTQVGPAPTSIITLSLANFGDLKPYVPLFEKMNLALHERAIAL